MVEKIKEALAVTAQVYDLIRETGVAGMSELELFLRMEQKLKQWGYQKEQYKFDFLSGSRTCEIDGGATSKIIRDKDLLLIDFSLWHEGVWCDTCRTFFFGEPSEEQADSYRLILSAMEAGIQTISSGVTGESVYQEVVGPILQQKTGGIMPHHAGHGIGESSFQTPVLDRGRTELLQAGDIVTLEPGIYFPGQWGIRIENDFLVTEEGAVLLFSYPLNLEYFILS